MWFANQTVVTSVLEDNVNTFVHFNDITLFCFEWTLNGLNLIVMGCDLGYTAVFQFQINIKEDILLFIIAHGETSRQIMFNLKYQVV